jgi:pSer/pThr/pTyr-binding forkhead associated (FHA) protein
MSARLTPINSNIGPVDLHRPVLLVGRHPECDVRLEYPSISRRHCCLATAYDRVTLRDLGSRNGVRVNGLRVEETILRQGDELAIGAILFRVELPQPVAPSPPAAAAPSPGLLPSLDEDDDLIPIDL